MKENKLKIIISLMTIAVAALISVQLYWITESVQLEEARFESYVNETLIRIATKLEKQETARVIVRRFTEGEKDSEEICDTIVTNGNNLFFITEVDDSSSSRFYTKPLPSHKIKIPELPKTHIKSKETKKTIRSSEQVFLMKSLIEPKHPDSLFSIEFVKDSFFVKRREFVDEIVEEIITGTNSKPIYERINTAALRTLIGEELQRVGIDLDFQYLVQDPEKNTVIISDSAFTRELSSSNHKTALFPGNIFSSKSHLSLFFPGEEYYFIQSIQSLLFVSIGLLLFIVGIFYHTAKALIKQKKITEIKNDLINNITHEFKTPLSTISLTCEALKEPEIASNISTVERYSNIIATEKNRLQEMVETLLKTALYEKDSLKIEPEETDVHKLIISETEKYKLSLERLNGKIIHEFTKSSSIIYADKFHLANAISNIIDNAIKYCEVKPYIVISTDVKKDYFVISLSDNGIGIAKSNINRIFESFYRVPTGNIQNVKGFGIGLSYTKKIVDTHKGLITVISKPGAGTTINISLPRGLINDKD